MRWNDLCVSKLLYFLCRDEMGIDSDDRGIILGRRYIEYISEVDDTIA